MKEENREIGQAVKKLIIESGISQSDIAKRLDINKSSLSQMLSGVAPLPAERFAKIAELIKASKQDIEQIHLLYIKREAKRIVAGMGGEEKLVAAAKKEIEKRLLNNEEVQLVTDDPSKKMFPVICEAAAAEVNTLSFPIAEWANEYSEERQYFPDGRDGDFAIRVSGTSMLPWYPPGTLLLVRPNQRIRHGERVIAIMESGEVLFKVYAHDDKMFGLMSLDDGGRDFLFPPHKAHEIRGLYRVIASVRNEEQLDSAMKRAGIHHRWESRFSNHES